jgi:two-component system, OmpR family, sensor kinase
MSDGRGRAVSRFRSVGARLSLALVAVVALALAVVYVMVVPSLERNLRQAKLDQLTRSAEALANQFPPFAFDPTFAVGLHDYIESASDTANARVVLYQPLDPQSGTLSVVDDSREGRSSVDVIHDEVAVSTALSLRTSRGVVRRNDEQLAEVAVPIPGDVNGNVLLFSASLEDSLANVRLVAKRVLVAGGVGLLLAVLLGYGGSSIFARRLRKLERAADRIASGKLDEPVVDEGADEVAQLARAFERMRKRLAQLEHARREFIANASHELRTPIFSLGGFLELLANEDLDEATRREFVASMQEQVERLTKLATDLLDLSRLDAGRLHVELEPLELPRIAEALVEEFTPTARVSSHPLGLEVADSVDALADEQRVLQIGRILVENAIRHTPPGTPIRLRVRQDGPVAVLSVEDAGPGISAEHGASVFERFYRVDGGRASGSGLGLAIARELAELMGGRLELQSQPGRTLFELTLPAVLAVRESARA